MILGATAGIMNGILRFYKNQSDIELREIRIEGAKEMLLVEEIDNKEFLTGVFNAMYDVFRNCHGQSKWQTDSIF